jgi:hypothetical protein
MGVIVGLGFARLHFAPAPYRAFRSNIAGFTPNPGPSPLKGEGS